MVSETTTIIYHVTDPWKESKYCLRSDYFLFSNEGFTFTISFPTAFFSSLGSTLKQKRKTRFTHYHFILHYSLEIYYIEGPGSATIKPEDQWSCKRSPDYWPGITKTKDCFTFF